MFAGAPPKAGVGCVGVIPLAGEGAAAPNRFVGMISPTTLGSFAIILIPLFYNNAAASSVAFRGVPD